jgi:hypothetical protein
VPFDRLRTHMRAEPFDRLKTHMRAEPVEAPLAHLRKAAATPASTGMCRPVV